MPKKKIFTKNPISIKKIIFAFIIFFFLSSALRSKSPSSTTSIPSTPTSTKTNPTAIPTKKESDSIVTKVIDGDTITVQSNGQIETIRLIGIDSPESVDPRKTVQCFAKEASDFAKKNLLNQKVRLESDPSQGDKDKYNRLLRYVFLLDGTSFNKTMLEQGFAHEYTYNTPYKYRDEFISAQNFAKDNNLGLWSPDACPIATSPPTATKIIEKTPVTNSGSWECNCAKLCSKMDGCAEAMYQLNTCGYSSRDSDGDGVPCENLCR